MARKKRKKKNLVSDDHAAAISRISTCPLFPRNWEKAEKKREREREKKNSVPLACRNIASAMARSNRKKIVSDDHSAAIFHVSTCPLFPRNGGKSWRKGKGQRKKNEKKKKRDNRALSFCRKAASALASSIRKKTVPDGQSAATFSAADRVRFSGLPKKKRKL